MATNAFKKNLYGALLVYDKDILTLNEQKAVLSGIIQFAKSLYILSSHTIKTMGNESLKEEMKEVIRWAENEKTNLK